MIDRARQEARGSRRMFTVSGLVPQLTSPSRDHGDLVDIWFGVHWRGAQCEWDESFGRLAEGWRPDPRIRATSISSRYPSNSRLIVARQVSPERTVWREVEGRGAGAGRPGQPRHDRSADAARATRRAVALADGRCDAAHASRIARSLRWLSEAKHAPSSVVPKLTIPVSHSSSSGSP